LSFPADLQNGESFLCHGIGVLSTGRLGHRTRQDQNPCTLRLLAWDLKSELSELFGLPLPVIKVDHPQLCALCRILQELSQMYRTLHFWEKAGTIRQWQFLGPVFDGEELRIQSDPLPC